ncbi:ABC transporter permease [Humisphaera borealis]|uniref:ABC transporter permease n=1 Tax=Humisphaera borealis TaxID=2807512 RepID=A0A7M2WSJ7_9BACT|nr:ABC transporter permease [Humisphaera borealis]QOV88505.1 ABC transporter permease [Humisphaera borealis]
MRVTRTIRTAVRALRRNIMRSILTTLGIIIGIAAVIAMMEIGNGVSAQIQKSITSLGANNLMIWPGSSFGGGVSYSSGRITLTNQDCDAIMERCPAVLDAAPIVNASGQLISGNSNYQVESIMGTTPAYLAIRELQIEEGEPFTDRDVVAGSPVCLVGKTVVRELFRGQNPVGREIRLQNVNLKVVGVLAPKGANMFGRDQDDVLLAPWTTIKYRISTGSGGSGSSSSAGDSSGTSSAVNSLNNRYPSGKVEIYPEKSANQLANTPMPVKFANVSQITCRAVSAGQTQAAVEQITEVLRERHRIRTGEPDDFRVRDMTELGNTLSSSSSLMTNLLLIVAAISLVVGGVGIMNIMLVSVTERTREIGLRMAVGARSRDILVQFLIEAILLCLAGGAVGILLGRLTSIVVRSVLNWATAVSVPAIVVSVAVSAFVGVAFGFYPAWKASRLDPIDALRYE